MSQPGSPPDARPDDRRILDELEQLQEAILASRATRERAEAAFDSELRAFDSPPSPAALTPAAPNALATPSTPPVETVAAGLTLPKPNRSPDVALFDDGDSTPVPPRSRAPLIAGGSVLLVLAALGLFWTTTRGPAGGGVPAATPPPPAVSRPVDVPAPPPKAVAADPHALRIDLTSLRRVWLRVSVDGRIALEREVAGGEQLPFGADRSIVVRAGDAGAVTVRVGADDQGPLGRDGQVVTRAFTVPER
jgi:hypothetical protein